MNNFIIDFGGFRRRGTYCSDRAGHIKNVVLFFCREILINFGAQYCIAATSCAISRSNTIHLTSKNIKHEQFHHCLWWIQTSRHLLLRSCRSYKKCCPFFCREILIIFKAQYCIAATSCAIPRRNTIHVTSKNIKHERFHHRLWCIQTPRHLLLGSCWSYKKCSPSFCREILIILKAQYCIAATSCAIPRRNTIHVTSKNIKHEWYSSAVSRRMLRRCNIGL